MSVQARGISSPFDCPQFETNVRILPRCYRRNFSPHVTTCPLWTSLSPLPVVAEV
jgi:hypothetical protein